MEKSAGLTKVLLKVSVCEAPRTPARRLKSAWWLTWLTYRDSIRILWGFNLLSWLVVDLPLWKIWVCQWEDMTVNGKDYIPYMKWKIKNVWNHQPDMEKNKHLVDAWAMFSHPFGFGCWVHWLLAPSNRLASSRKNTGKLVAFPDALW